MQKAGKRGSDNARPTFTLRAYKIHVRRQHFLYFFPLPQGQGSFLPARVLSKAAAMAVALGAGLARLEPVTATRPFPGAPLVAAGHRVLVPWLRGYGPTRFRDPSAPRTAQQTALAQDVLDFADALKIERFAMAGFDWGNRAACIVSIVAPEA